MNCYSYYSVVAQRQLIQLIEIQVGNRTRETLVVDGDPKKKSIVQYISLLGLINIFKQVAFFYKSETIST